MYQHNVFGTQKCDKSNNHNFSYIQDIKFLCSLISTQVKMKACEGGLSLCISGLQHFYIKYAEAVTSVLLL